MMLPFTVTEMKEVKEALYVVVTTDPYDTSACNCGFTNDRNSREVPTVVVTKAGQDTQAFLRAWRAKGGQVIDRRLKEKAVPGISD